MYEKGRAGLWEVELSQHFRTYHDYVKKLEIMVVRVTRRNIIDRSDMVRLACMRCSYHSITVSDHTRTAGIPSTEAQK